MRRVRSRRRHTEEAGTNASQTLYSKILISQLTSLEIHTWPHSTTQARAGIHLSISVVEVVPLFHMFEPLPFLLEVVVGLVVVVVRVVMLPVVVWLWLWLVLSGVVGVVVVVGADANTASVVVFKAQSHGSRAVSETEGQERGCMSAALCCWCIK